MDTRGKKLFIIAFLVVLLFLVVTGYFLFFNKKPSQNDPLGVNPNLFPFDQQSNQIKDLPVVIDGETASTEDTALEEIVDSEAANRNRLRKVTSFSVSGFVSFITQELVTKNIFNTETNTEQQITVPTDIHRIRYNEQRTGHLYEGIISDTSIVNKKITENNLPNAEELIFNRTGDRGILRYEKNNSIESFQIELPPKNTNLSEYCTISLTTDLRSGMRGDEVKNLQKYLSLKLNKQITLDGVFFRQTETLVKSLQGELGLPINGIFDDSVRQLIMSECAEKQAAISALGNMYELRGSILEGYIPQMVKNNNENNLFYIKQVGQKSSGFLKQFNSTFATPIFESPFNEWLPQFVNKNLISMTTYATADVGGYLYFLDSATQKFNKILGPMPGLTTLTSPDGNNVLISYIENQQLTTKIVHLNKSTQTTLPFTTLSEKCTWYTNDQIYCGVPRNIPRGNYPDDWYKGLLFFNDSLWNYTLSTNRAVFMVTPREPVDIFRIESFLDSEYLFFIDKESYELWSYRIGGED